MPVQALVYAIATSTAEEVTPAYVAYQRQLMESFLCLEKEFVSATVTGSNLADCVSDVLDICAWNGVECTRGKIFALYWTRFGNAFGSIVINEFDTAWLPPSLLMMTTSGQQSLHEFSTRHIPRKIAHMEMDSCALHGSLDLTILSDSLKTLILCKNKFYGTVTLTQLPAKLLTLTLNDNRLRKLIVRNEALPTAKMVDFDFTKQPKGFKVRCIDAEQPFYRLKLSR